jgi:DNA-binding GntR family transcriptional regulator
VSDRRTPPDETVSVDNSNATSAHRMIRHSLLGDQVYERLWQLIVAHQLLPGVKLSDVRLSEELGVSRTPVREALHRLAQDGIVRAESRRGFFVAGFSREDVQEIYDVRSALEVLAIRLACANLTDADLEQAQQALDDVVRRIASGEEGANEAFLVVDQEFHQMIIRAARNRRLAGLLNALYTQIGVYRVYGVHLGPLTKLSIEHHQRILTALRRHDRKAAEQAMERHITEVKQHVLAELISSQ